MSGIGRQRRAALDRDEGIEAGRLRDLQKRHAGKAAMGYRKLVDDGNPEPGLDQRADGVAETRTAQEAAAILNGRTLRRSRNRDGILAGRSHARNPLPRFGFSA